jgi:hypothetical protein
MPQVRYRVAAGAKVRGTRGSEFAMKPLLIVLTAVVVVGVSSTLAIMNKSCKSTHHTWCAPAADIQHHTKIRHS